VNPAPQAFVSDMLLVLVSKVPEQLPSLFPLTIVLIRRRVPSSCIPSPLPGLVFPAIVEFVMVIVAEFLMPPPDWLSVVLPVIVELVTVAVPPAFQIAPPHPLELLLLIVEESTTKVPPL
jgi:hypothetical protein